MTNEPKPNNRDQELKQPDLIELILEPLASQVDQSRLQILEQLEKINDSIDMIAREMGRKAAVSK